MCNIDWLLVLEYAKVFLSWPVMAAIVSILIILKFREAINNFLNRTTEANILGQQLKAVPPQLQTAIVESSFGTEKLSERAEQENEATSLSTDDLPPELRSDPNALLAIEYAKKNPIDVVVEYRRLNNAYICERLFVRIYGTQIALLNHLANSPDVWFYLAQLSVFHAEHQKLSGVTTYNIFNYVNYLAEFGVLLVETSSNGQVYKISKFGIEFLAYIKANYALESQTRPY